LKVKASIKGDFIMARESVDFCSLNADMKKRKLVLTTSSKTIKKQKSPKV